MQRGSSAYIITPITKIIYNNHRHSFHGKHLVGFPSASLRDSRIWAQSDGNDASVNVDEPDEDRRDNNYKWSAQIFAIALPALAGMMTDPILSMVDTLFVGQLGVTSTMMSTTKAAATAASPSSTSSIPLAALGACTSIFHLAFHCVKGTTATTASLVAGAVVRDEQKQQADEKGITQKETTLIAQTSMQQAFITGTVISLFLLAFGTKCLNAMGIPTSSKLLFSSAFTYLNYRAVAAPAVVLLTASEGIFRGFGDVITPWKVSLVVAGLNLVLDPFCMFRKQTGMGMMGLGMGIKGAAVATSFSQLCGALLYGSLLLRQGVLRSNDDKGGSITKIAWKKLKQIVSRKSNDSAELKQKKRAIALTILRANAAMILKQGSLLLGWAYATSRATRMGHSIVAAHQMGLSIWMLFSYALDGISVAAQVLMAREYEELRIVENNSDEKFAGQQKKVRSLSIYMMSASLLQGLIVSAAVLLLYKLQPSFILTNDPAVRTNLLQLFPHLSAQMTLVSATLVAEALTVGGGRFKWLAFGTTVSSLVAMTRLRLSTSLIGIWSGGIVSLFLGRLITALLAVLDMNGFIPRRKALVAEEEAE
eukprot:scaffold4587_cov144-Skeletonema_dohrnii-CCMP3373.AAC.3